MYRASKDIILPTTITGSLPRPSWYTENLGTRHFLQAMVNRRFREQYEDALTVYLRDQELAGLDILSDGDCRFDDDVVWHTPGQHPLAGSYEGRAAAFASFAEEFEQSGDSYNVQVHDVLANDEHIVAFLHATAGREGKRLAQDYAIIFEMREGKVRAAWEVWKDQASVDEFWS